MTYLAARVESGVAYLWGEAFAIVGLDKSILVGKDSKEVRASKYNNGWYYAKLSKKDFMDKKGIERKYISIVEPVGDTEELKRIINIYYGTPEGIKDVLQNYSNLIPLQIRQDTRYKAFVALSELIDYSSELSKEHEMGNFVSKVCCIVAGRIIRDKFAKKENINKHEISE